MSEPWIPMDEGGRMVDPWETSLHRKQRMIRVAVERSDGLATDIEYAVIFRKGRAVRFIRSSIADRYTMEICHVEKMDGSWVYRETLREQGISISEGTNAIFYDNLMRMSLAKMLFVYCIDETNDPYLAEYDYL